MELEKEIKQHAKFTSEYHKLSVNILYSASWLSIMHARKLKPFGLTLQQFNLLRILRGQHPEPATVNMLIERMIDKSSNASRLVDRLAQKGLVKRTICENDKRSVNVKINDKGLEILKKIDSEINLLDEELRSLTKEEAKRLNQLLDKMRG